MKALFSYIPKFMLIIIALSLTLHEFYPLSHFPMYSTFGSSAIYVYVTDGNDQPIAIKKYFKYSTPKLKKMYIARLKKLKNEEAAAHALLSYLLAETDPEALASFQALKLYLVDIKLRNKEITRQATFLAEVEL